MTEGPHNAEGLVTQSPEHVDSENIKLKIGRRTFLYQLFSKRDLNSKKLAKIGKN
jgi:hypothetical protein